MPTLKVYRAKTPDHAKQQITFFILARGLRAARWNAQSVVLKHGIREWSQAWVVEADADEVEAQLGLDVNNYLVGPIH